MSAGIKYIIVDQFISTILCNLKF